MGWGSKNAVVLDAKVNEALDEAIFADKKAKAQGTARVWSKQQLSIFEWFKSGKGNLVVNALAGTGKTTTILEAVKHAPETRILLCAFNKSIAEELNSRLVGTSATAKTLHALGFGLIRNNWGRVTVAKGKDRENYLTNTACPDNTPYEIKKLVTKLHNKVREIKPLADTVNEVLPLAYAFECVPEEFWEKEGYDVEWVASAALEAVRVSDLDSKCPKTGIDFADMICLPIRRDWAHPEYDLVVVDEAQDMNMAQLLLAQGVCRGRKVIVGDKHQAIYGFRGANSHSLRRLTEELDASQLTLSTTYRCGHAIVAEAQQYAPNFEAGKNNHDGEVLHMGMDAFYEAVKPGDFVLSRLNAPLARIAMNLLRDGVRARVKGRDIGAGLTRLVDRCSKKSDSIESFLHALYGWEMKEVTRCQRLKLEAAEALVMDQAATVRELAAAAGDIDNLKARIDTLFTDDGLGDAGMVTCSSVHKAKGLEADNVFLLDDTFRRGKSEEEDNIVYVGITRAKHTLTYVMA